MVNERQVRDYLQAYLAELDRISGTLAFAERRLLPDHLVAHGEIHVFLTSSTGVAIDYVGIGPETTVRVTESNENVNDLLFPASTKRVPESVAFLALPPMRIRPEQKHLITIVIQGSLAGIVLLKFKGDGNPFGFVNLRESEGRYVLTNLYVQREYADGHVASRFLRRAELFPNKQRCFTVDYARENARYDVTQALSAATFRGPGEPPPTDARSLEEALILFRPREIIVLGPDREPEIAQLRRIRDEIRVLNYDAKLIREIADIPEQSLEEKVRLRALTAAFVVIEDSIPGGQIAEFGYCKELRVITAVLRRRGHGSTWMTSDAGLVDLNFIKIFEYDDSSLQSQIVQAVGWAEAFREKRRTAYDARYPWRVPRHESSDP